MQPISFNANSLASNMAEGHLAKAKAMENMAGQMNAMGGQGGQYLSQLGQVTPASPAASPASITQTQPAGGGVFDNVLGNFVNEVNGKHVKMGNSLQAMLSGQNGAQDFAAARQQLALEDDVFGCGYLRVGVQVGAEI